MICRRGNEEWKDPSRLYFSAKTLNSTVAESIAEELSQAILSGNLPQGERLPLQELAKNMGTSITPIREALRRLESLGLVTVLARQGAYVREVSVRDAESIYEARMLIEPRLVRLSAERWITDGQLEAVESIFSQMKLAAGLDREKYSLAHRELHWKLYECADSPWLLRACEVGFASSERYRIVAHGPGDSAVPRLEEHRELVDAWRAHNGVRAEEVLRNHLGQTLQRVRMELRRCAKA